VNRRPVVKKQTCNSRLNSYNKSKKIIKICRRYYKVVTKLLQRANKGTATERFQSSVIKKAQDGKIFKI
jgi:hypothetical protein